MKMENTNQPTAFGRYDLKYELAVLKASGRIME
jgi:hypothetical protein